MADKTFREMRRGGQQLSRQEAIAILETGQTGVLAVSGDEGYPYAVPVSYVYLDDTIFFHSATTGHKIDAIKRDSRVSFCVIETDRVIPEAYTDAYRSVIAFGRACIVDDPTEKLRSLEALGRKYNPDGAEESLQVEIARGIDHLVMVAISIEHLTGKEAIELTRQRKMKGRS